ncbi:hypothetical protein D3C81_1722190 [compost metagenome]
MPVDLLQPKVVKPVDRSKYLLLPLRVIGCYESVGDDVRQRLERLGPGQDLADLADGYTALDPAADAADPLDIDQRIQAMPAFGACWNDQAITSLPGTQRDRVDTCQARHFTNGKELFLFERGRLRGI